MLSLEQVQKATMATTANAQNFLDAINATCDQYEINTPVRQLCFLAQVGHESGGLFYTEELASGSAYEGRHDLGNSQVGDGIRFKGRGLIQITGRANYAALSNDLGVDFVGDPTLLGGKNVVHCTPDQLMNAARSAGWFWNKHDLNAIADLVDVAAAIDAGENLTNFKAITRKINGGYNGLEDRIARYKSGQKLFSPIAA